VIATVVLRATARAVCSAFVAAMRTYGIPEEVLSRNGKQFAGRFGKPRPAEVLFERICRENAITQRLTKPRSPTTTGEIERLHQTLQQELLTVHEPFVTMAEAQVAVDAWRQDYNADRPHQSLGMAFPSARFAVATGQVLSLRVPAELDRPSPVTAASSHASADALRSPAAPRGDHQLTAEQAVEVERVVPPSGNLWLAGQQIWLGPAMTGRTIRLWAGLDRVHVLLDGHRIKTLPSRLERADLARLAAAGATPAGPPPLPVPSGNVIELERTVNASGILSIGDHVISAGVPLAGRRVTLRLEGPVAHILSGVTLVRTVACPVPEPARSRLRGARTGTARPPRLPEPLQVRRRVSARGAIMIGGQRIQVGLPHAGKTAEITIDADSYQILVEDAMAITAPRTTSHDIRRHKASNYGSSPQRGSAQSRQTIK
jgi:hypothetical protein